MSARWFAVRLVSSVGVLLIVALATFVLSFQLPVDPAVAAAGPHAPLEALQRAREQLGIDRPLLLQLGDYLLKLAHGNLGQSYSLHREVLSLIAERLPATLELAAGAMAVELALGVALGVPSVVWRARPAGRASDLAAIVAVGLPSIWVGYLLLYAFAFLPQQAFGVELLPVGAYQPLDVRFLLLPAITLALPGAGTCARLIRVALDGELRQDYARTARAKGVSERRIVWRHALPNASGPVVSELGLDLGSFVGGVVIVESIFSWPGVGQLAIQSIERNDLPVVMGTVLLGALAVVTGNLAADVIRVVIDPRLVPQEGL